MHTHTCHPWSLDSCSTERHRSSDDNFFLSPNVGTTRSLYLRDAKKNRKIWNCRDKRARRAKFKNFHETKWHRLFSETMGSQVREVIRQTSQTASVPIGPGQRLLWTVSWMETVVLFVPEVVGEKGKVSYVDKELTERENIQLYLTLDVFIHGLNS